jgi:hypothetical protein
LPAHFRAILRVLSMTTLLCLLLLAAEGSWSDVEALAPRERIQIVKRDKKSLQGEFVRVSADEILINSSGQAITVPRPEVVRISRSGGRSRNALLGAAIGAAAGAAAGVFPRVRLNNETDNGDQIFGAMIAAGGGLGAALGASQVHFVTIYRAP